METQRFKFTKTPDYLFEYSIKDGQLFIHCDVYKWKPSVLRHMYSTFYRFTNEARELGVSSVYSITQNKKFTELFNGEKMGDIENEGERYEVVRWVLK